MCCVHVSQIRKPLVWKVYEELEQAFPCVRTGNFRVRAWMFGFESPPALLDNESSDSHCLPELGSDLTLGLVLSDVSPGC